MSTKYSGRFVVRIPPSLHRVLRKEAEDRGISLNAHCSDLLARGAAIADTPLGSRGSDRQPWLNDLAEMLGGALVGVVLFGSTARGDARAGSDADLLVVLEPSAPLNRQLYARWDAIGAADVFSPHFVRLPDRVEDAGSLWLEAAIDGILLQDGNGRIAMLLGQIRRRIAGGRLSRGMAHGHPYWVHNEKEGSHA